MNLFDLYARIILDTGNFEDGLSNAGKKMSDFAKKMKTGLATATKIGVATIGAASAGIVALTKASIDSYAEYEQLVGGVETLFKGSADIVKKYAENAYKTAGMSANEYMETVTGFSASLLQSLGGNTAAAAEKADKAITDMADNANKMGSDISMIQNAYQGFAKQNYTMLDNLKLGYGGTKEEMERLLKDAEKLSGQKFDLSSYADIVDAIHIVQTEMGITGTTAAEAASTIQGSVAAMKSAWSNLVTGIGDENADLDTLINNFVESVGTAGENILPRVEKIISGIGKLIEKIAPIISEKLPDIISTVLPSLLSAGVQLVGGIAQGLITAFPSLVKAVGDAVLTVASSAKDSFPQFLEIGGELISYIVDGIVTGIPLLADAAVELANSLSDGVESGVPVVLQNIISILYKIVNVIITNAPKFLEAASIIISSLAKGLIDYLPTLLEWIPFLIKSLTTTLAKNLPEIAKMAIMITSEIAEGLINSTPDILMAIPEIAVSIVEGFSDLDDAFREIGKNIIDGILQGIIDTAKNLMAGIGSVISEIVDGVKNLLGIHSPSRVFAGIGENMALGLGEGWGKEYSQIKQKIESGMDFGTANVDFSSSGLGRSSKMISNGISTAVSSGVSGDVVINLTNELDSATISRKTYRYNISERVFQGGSLINGD